MARRVCIFMSLAPRRSGRPLSEYIMEPVATLELIQVSPDGERKPVRVQIGQPQFDERGSWACPVIITSVSDKVREIHGDDSMQALCLGIQFVRSMLQSALDGGSRLLHADEDTDFHPEVYFGANGQQTA
jgi:hypothetical protein